MAKSNDRYVQDLQRLEQLDKQIRSNINEKAKLIAAGQSSGKIDY